MVRSVRAAALGGIAIIVAALDTAPASAIPVDPSNVSAGHLLEVTQVVSRIGANRAAQERAEFRRYRGNRGAQQILRQKRQNLCRNVPEMC